MINENQIPEFEQDVLEFIDPIIDEPIEDTSDDKIETQVEEDDSAFALFKTLKDKNIIPYDEGEEIKSWEKLEERLSEIPQLVTKSIIEQSPEHTKKLFQYAFTKGDSLTKDDLKTFINTYLEDESDQEIESNDDARKVLEKVYKEQGMNQKAIRAALDVLEDDDELIEEAKKHKTSTQADKLIQDAQKDVDNKRKADENFVKEIQKNLVETGWQKERLASITKELTSNVINEKLSTISKDPKGIIQLANFLSYFDLKSRTFNFDAFIKQTFSKDANNIKQSILKDNFTSISSTTSSSSTNPKKIKLEDLIPIIETD